MAPRRGGKLDPHWLGTLHESPANVYSFVSNALIAVCRETDNERLNDVALACAELTASFVPSLIFMLFVGKSWKRKFAEKTRVENATRGPPRCCPCCRRSVR